MLQRWNERWKNTPRNDSLSNYVVSKPPFAKSLKVGYHFMIIQAAGSLFSKSGLECLCLRNFSSANTYSN